MDGIQRDGRHFRETAHLRRSFLLPFLLAIVALALLFVYAIYIHQLGDVRDRAARLHASISKHYRHSVHHNTIALQSIIEVLKEKDKELCVALEHGDRAALLKESAPVLARLREIFEVTHMYFMRADRVNLLRVHQPDRHGDVIDRFTLREAERTGRQAHGVELGPLGMLTLRVVEPVYAGGEGKRLTGYMEIGMELDSALGEVREIQGVQTYLLIRKQFLQREAWESGMRMLGHMPDWGRFRDFVVGSGHADIPPAYWENGSEKVTDGAGPGMADVLFGQASFYAFTIPLHDAAGRDIGRLMVQLDVSDDAAKVRNLGLLGVAVILLAGGVLLVFFHWRLGRVGAQLEDRSSRLLELATRDSLTKLFNRRMFHTLLEREAARTKRYNAPVSLLMLDIDHFKRVNDTHGHVAGDMVLAGVGSLVSSHIRNMDSACRYGGEEISIILPETGMEDAVLLAERIRQAIERHRFDIGQEQGIGVTVSIGVASLHAQETAAERLVVAADKALYEAKESGRNRVCRG